MASTNPHDNQATENEIDSMLEHRPIKTTDSYGKALSEMRKATGSAEKALPLLEQAVDEGDKRAAYALATWYLHGKEPIRKSITKAVRLLKIAAQAKIPEACYDLAICYETGSGIAKNERTAFRLYQAAALAGDEQSVFEVGRCYYYGIGTAQDRRISKVWFDRARDLGLTYESARGDAPITRPVRIKM